MSRLLAAIVVSVALFASTSFASELRLSSLSGESIDPFASPHGTRAMVFLFISTECPISNKYAPELRRLYERFASERVVFRLIYPNPSESPEAIRVHLDQYGFRGEALRDPRHELVQATRAAITPEAVVYDTAGRLLYRGRIDDRFVSPGLQRATPARRDLEDALAAIVEGKPVSHAGAPAVGCFIADFAR